MKPVDKSSASRVLGKGLSVAEWVRQHPDRFVTRRDVTILFALHANAERRVNTWWRKLWRWLLTPIIRTEEDPLPPPSSFSSSSPRSGGPLEPSPSASGLENAVAEKPPSASP